MTAFYTDKDFYIPAFEVILGAGTVRLKENVMRDVTQVTYSDNIKQIDSFEITINNWDAEKKTFKYIDKDTFDPGKELQLWMGYYERGNDTLEKMITGEITGLRPSFPTSGQPTLAISGLNLLHKFRKKQETQAYEKNNHREIVQNIANRIGAEIIGDLADVQEYKYLLQKNEYDIVFLMNRAREVGYELFVEEGGDQPVLNFRPSTDAKTVPFEFKYGASLIQFQPNLSIANQVGKVTVTGSSGAAKKKGIKCTATREKLKIKTPDRFRAAIDKREEKITDRTVESDAEALRLATQKLEDNAKELITGSGSVVGLPSLRAGSAVEITGVGELFSGRYFVTSTTHTINDSGYTTQFGCRKETKD